MLGLEDLHGRNGDYVAVIPVTGERLEKPFVNGCTGRLAVLVDADEEVARQTRIGHVIGESADRLAELA